MANAAVILTSCLFAQAAYAVRLNHTGFTSARLATSSTCTKCDTTVCSPEQLSKLTADDTCCDFVSDQSDVHNYMVFQLCSVVLGKNSLTDVCTCEEVGLFMRTPPTPRPTLSCATDLCGFFPPDLCALNIDTTLVGKPDEQECCANSAEERTKVHTSIRTMFTNVFADAYADRPLVRERANAAIVGLCACVAKRANKTACECADLMRFFTAGQASWQEFSEVFFCVQVIALDTPLATGDPHVKNVLQEAFDINRVGLMKFIEIPRGAADFAFLTVVADVQPDDRAQPCKEKYIMSATVAGKWLGDVSNITFSGQPWSDRTKTMGMSVSGGDWFDVASTKDLLGKATSLKLGKGVYAGLAKETTKVGWKLRVKGFKMEVMPRRKSFLDLRFHLPRNNIQVGGLLGADSHFDAEKLPEACK